MTHPHAGCWVTAAEAPAGSPATLGAEGGVRLMGGRCLGSPRRPFSLRQRPTGRLGSVPPQALALQPRDTSRVGLWPAQPQRSHWSALH